MKKAIYFLFIFCFTFSFSSAQQELLDGEWVLDYVVVDNNTYVAPPLFSTVPACLPIDYFPGINFELDSGGEYQAVGILTFNYWFHDDANASMTIDSNSFTTLGAVTLGQCDCICDLEGYYLSTILAGDFTLRTFDYVIENISGNEILTITSPEGDTAVFYNYALSVNDEENERALILYPNPSDSKVNILIQNAIVQSLAVYSVAGKNVMNYSNVVPATIDVSNLSNGLYFMEIISTEGQKYIQRFVKR